MSDELKLLREENQRLLRQLASLKAGIRMTNTTMMGTMAGSLTGRGP